MSQSLPRPSSPRIMTEKIRFEYVNPKITTTAEFLKIIEKNINLKNFMEYFKQKVIYVGREDEILFKYDGFAFEKLVELCFAFKVTDFKDAIICFGDGEFKSFEDGAKNLNKYLTTDKFRSGSDEGKADIKFKIKKSDGSYDYYACSNKYYQKYSGEDNEKDLDKYDGSQILTEFTDYVDGIVKGLTLPNLRVVLFVKNAEMLKKKMKKHWDRKYRNTLKELCKKGDDFYIYGQTVIDVWYRRLRTLLQKNESLPKRVACLSQDKPNLKLRPHQYIIMKKYMQLTKRYNEILINGVPRCGKTYLLGGIILNMFYDRVLWITPRPSSCSEGYIKMINKYKCFDNLNLQLSFEGDKDQMVKYDSDKYIHIVSRQAALDKKTKENRGIILDYTKYELVVIDECQLCMGNYSIKNIEKMLKVPNLHLLYLTGTSENVEEIRNINEERIIRYTYSDVMTFKKSKDIDYLLSHYYPDIMHDYLKENNLHDKNRECIIREIQGPYQVFPDLEMIHVEMDENMYTYDEELGFNISKLFGMNEDKTKFLHVKNIQKVFNQIFGTNQGLSNFSLVEEVGLIQPVIHLVYLPCGGQGSKIDLLQKNLITLLQQNEYFNDDYDIIGINSKQLKKKLVENVEKKFQESRRRSKSLIVLLGEMLTVGCSIENAHTVTILAEESNKYKHMTIQKLMRPLTEKEGKKKGYVFMFQPNEEDSFEILWKVTDTPNIDTKEHFEFILREKMFRILNKDMKMKSFTLKDMKTLFTKVTEKYFKENDNIKLNMEKMTKEEIETFKKNVSKNLIKNYQDSRKTNTKYGNVKTYKKKIKKDRVVVVTNQLQEGIDDLVESGDIHTTFTKLYNMAIIICNPNVRYLDFRDEVISRVINEKNVFKSLRKTFNLNLNSTLRDKEDLIIAIDFIFDLIRNNKICGGETDLKMRFQYIQGKKIKLKDNYCYSDMLETLKNLLKATEKEKKDRGEVFTPPELVDKMLKKIPSNEFKNPRNKWFDPANGMGNFMVCLFNILDSHRGLIHYKEKMKNKKGEIFNLRNTEQRRRWILEEMFYVSEIDPLNCILYESLFNPEGKYELNIYCGDSLKLDIKKKWNIDGFDIIIGNPPYQANQKSTGKRGGGDLLWNKFVFKSLNNWLKPNGYLCFVHPALWRKPVSKNSKTKGLFRLMTKVNSMIYLNMNDLETGKKVFNAGTRFDFYVIKRKENVNVSTIIVDYQRVKHKYNLKNFKFLPHYNINQICKFIDNEVEMTGDETKIIFNRSNYGSDKKYVSSNRTDEFKYPLIHATNIKGVRYFYSQFNDKGHFNIPKVIFGDSGINKVIIDMEGKYGMTQHAMGIPVETKEEAEKIKNILENKKFQDILKPCIFSNFGIDWRIFLYFKRQWWRDFKF